MKKILFVFLISLFCMSMKSDITFVVPYSNIWNGYVVGTVKASDPDAGQKLKYSIVAGNTNASFKIGAYTGIITINNATYIKTRIKKYFDIVVKVTDSGGYNANKKWVVLSSQATVTIITAK